MKKNSEIGLGLTDLRKIRYSKDISDNNLNDNGDHLNFIGISLDSQSFDQSIIDQSINEGKR